LYFAGVTGPGQFNMDASLMKEFKITERLRFQVKLDSFNVMNNISWNYPSTSYTDPNFGISTNQADGTFGRRTQIGMRLEF
jgi:outer membrane scaffolding protein for murein synthesis (MipA/OmpV family)